MRVMGRGELIKNCCENQLGSKWECPPRKEYHYISSSSAKHRSAWAFSCFLQARCNAGDQSHGSEKRVGQFWICIFAVPSAVQWPATLFASAPQLDNGSPCVPWKRISRDFCTDCRGFSVCVTNLSAYFPRWKGHHKSNSNIADCDCRLLTVVGIWSPRHHHPGGTVSSGVSWWIASSFVGSHGRFPAREALAECFNGNSVLHVQFFIIM